MRTAMTLSHRSFGSWEYGDESSGNGSGGGGATDQCFNFTSKQFHIIIGVKDTTATISTVLCLTAIVLIVFTHAYRQFVHRLTLYLNIAALGYSIVFLLQTAPVEFNHDKGKVAVRDDYEWLCKAAGFLHQYAGWTTIIFICWITVYLCILVVWKQTPRKKAYEITGVIVSLLFPCTFVWIPFIHDMYGLAGAWCWIRLTRRRCALKDFAQGLAYQFATWYGPVAIVVTLNFVAICIMLLALCRKVKWRRRGYSQIEAQEDKQYRKAIKEILPLLFYPLFFLIILSMAVANRVSYAVTDSKNGAPFFPLWVVHGFADPARPLMIPLAFLLHPYTLKRLRCGHLRTSVEIWRNMASTTANTECIIPPEGDDIEQPLVVRSTNTGLGRHARPRTSTVLDM